MPGPYDIYGEDRSTTSRLPMGLGNAGIGGMWPDLLLLGGGSLLSRIGVRHAQGKKLFSKAAGWGSGFGLKNTPADIAMGSAMDAGRARGGTGPTMRKNAGYAAHRAQTTHFSTPGQPVYVEKKAKSRKKGASKAPKQRYRKVATPDINWVQHGKGASAFPRGSAAAVEAAGTLRARSGFGASMQGFGKMARGAGLVLGGMQAFAMFTDMARGVGQAAVDYSPRRPHYSGTQGFGEFFIDPRGAYTQRQRAMAAIHDSQLTSRAAIGGEAAFMHR